MVGAAAWVAAAGCVRVDPGPSGVASAVLTQSPPSIVAGDTLRDADGRATALQATAFDESGRPVANPRLRYVYVPTQRDTLQRLVLDSALQVDSALGTVVARARHLVPQGLIALRVGDRLQIVDTLQIVPRPTAAVTDTAVTLALRFRCTDTARTRSPRPLAPIEGAGGIDTQYVFNALGPFRVLVRGDSLAADSVTRVAAPRVRARLVRWQVESAPANPFVRLPGGRAADTIPALGIVTPRADRLTGLDTTDNAGLSSVQLRIRPSGFTRRLFPTDTFSVVLRADVQPGPVPVAGGTQRFRVRLERDPGTNCP